MISCNQVLSLRFELLGGIAMVSILMGLKGSGKTKRLVDMVREAVKAETGDVVCIERERKLTFDIP